MARRVALFADQTETEDYFGISINHPGLFSGRYNISPSFQLPVVYRDNKVKKAKPVQWGDGPGGVAVISRADAEKAIEERNVKPCVAVISGFYVWKDDKEKEHPFFVRMLNAPLMAVASLMFNGSSPHFKMITAESNVLIQPMTETMPLLLDSDLSGTWLDEATSVKDVLREGIPQFLLTELSVLRVTKKVNDPKNDDPSLIQPIPK